MGLGTDSHWKKKTDTYLSQSFEEADRDPDETIRKHSDCDLLVLAARPEEEPGSKLPSMRRALSDESFRVNVVRIHNKGQAEEKAQEVFELLASLRQDATGLCDAGSIVSHLSKTAKGGAPSVVMLPTRSKTWISRRRCTIRHRSYLCERHKS